MLLPSFWFILLNICQQLCNNYVSIYYSKFNYTSKVSISYLRVVKKDLHQLLKK